MINDDTVRHLVNFLQTGDRRYFEAFRADAEPFVERGAAVWLRNHLVVGPDGAADQNAVSDVKQGFLINVLKLSTKSNKAGWFDPVRFGWSADRLRGWIYQLMRNTAVDYCRLFHSLGKKRAPVTFSDLEFNEGRNVESLLKPAQKGDFDAFELQEIVAECLRSLSQPHQELFQLRFFEGLSQRQAAERLGVTAATVCRRDAALKRAVDGWFRDRGIDGATLIA